MRRLLLFSLCCALSLVEGIEGISFDHYKGAIPNAPTTDVPLPLREAWLRFHEAELCQGLDAVFVFQKTGMEVWARIDDEKSYRKFAELLVPLQASHRIHLYATHPVPDKKPSDPPPSLLENAELRGYLQDPYTSIGSPDDSVEVSPRDLARKAGSPWGDGKPGGAPAMAVPLPSPDLKERLLMFAEQTLDWTRQMKRYADDLPALAFVAFDPTEPPNVRSRALAICLEHSQKVDKCAGRLEQNLTHALPNVAKPGSVTSSSDRSGFVGMPPTESAIRISDAADAAARQIHQFIYPRNPTVGVRNLRAPDLLESLQKLRKMAKEFQAVHHVRRAH